MGGTQGTVMRGKLIALATKFKRQKLQELEDHLLSLRTLTTQHKRDPTPDLMAKIKTHQQAIKTFKTRDPKKRFSGLNNSSMRSPIKRTLFSPANSAVKPRPNK
ncbi:Hypothetical predicted protein [Pelobates cultripes]|uniref:Uncharacterized protein n=1 Tax=Pelobates cultripes TaxID=61616 RepID=A0AAD1RHK5_PELCU|nr:Hypothetical predicted protein [Pelobates cultripes]